MLISGSLPAITSAGHYTKFEPLDDLRYTIFSNKSNRNLSNEWCSYGVMYAELFSTTRYSFPGVPTALPQLYSMFHSGSSVSLYINGTSKGSASANFTSGDIYGIAQIGLNASALNFEGLLQEHILYPSSDTSNRSFLESNIQNQYTTGSDTDYQAFITASNITATTQSNALQVLVSDLKQYGLWNKMKAVYPMVADKLNTVSNSKTFSNFGSVFTASQADPFGGTDAVLLDSYVNQQFWYVTTFGIPNTTGSQSVYIKASGSGYQAIEFGAYVYYPASSGWNTLGRFQFNNRVITASNGGYYEALPNDWYRVWVNPTLSGSYTGHEFNLTTAYLGGGITNNKFYFYGPQYELNSTGRPSQYNATTSSITVGAVTASMLSQMKYNLKDTGSFSGSYIGGWIPDYSGNTPNGVDGYMDTNFKPSTSGSLNNQSLSVYNRTANMDTGFFIAARDTTSTPSFLTIQFDPGKADFSSVNRTESNVGTYTNLQGMIIVSRLSSTLETHYKNAQPQISVAQSSVSLPNYNLTIGARNWNGSIQSGTYTKFNNAFTTIGDGLSDYEAKALYWIVQKYQTTLGRQVY
jgi:hypothetical protein